MSSYEDFYASSSRPVSQSFPSATQSSATPPPPPPKPTAHNYTDSQEPSRTGTPNISQSLPTRLPLPPTPRDNTATSSPRPPPPIPNSQSTPIPHVPAYHYQPQQQTVVQPPSLSDRWLPNTPTLQSYSTSDLHPLLQHEALLTAISQTHPSYGSSMAPLNIQLDSNIHLSTQLSALATQLSTLRHHTSQLLLQHASLQQAWRRKQSEMDDALSPWGPRAMYQRLISSISEQESLLKAVQESFLEGGGDHDYYAGAGSGGKASEKEVSEWIRRIREGTTTLERRREMRARWDEGRVMGWR